MCGETEQSRMSCSECLSFGAAHPKLQKLNRGGTWPNLGRLAVYPKSLNLELILQGTRTNDKKDSFYYPDHTVPTNKQFLCFLLVHLSVLFWFLPTSSESHWTSTKFLFLKSVRWYLLLTTSSWYNQGNRQKWKNRQTWKISFKICFITRSLSYLFKEPTFATGILWTACWCPLNTTKFTDWN